MRPLASYWPAVMVVPADGLLILSTITVTVVPALARISFEENP